MRFKKTFLLTLLLSVGIHVFAQTGKLEVGFRFQQSVNLYNENGLSLQYSHPGFKYDKMYFGAHFVTSRLGTALGSNAIKQDNYLLSTGYFLRKGKYIRPFGRLNVGLFSADYGNEIFDQLDQKAMLVSTEIGVAVDTPWNIKWLNSIGYNANTGNGVSGPGTLYPVFIQTTLSWKIDLK